MFRISIFGFEDMATAVPTQRRSLRLFYAVSFHLAPKGVVADSEFSGGTASIPLAVFEYLPYVDLLHSFHTHITRALR